jgi:putative holliday junction resolvase
MTRLLALDVGDSRVGLAFSDESRTIATPHGVLARGKAEEEILKLVEKEGLKEIVVGLPLSETGGETDQSAKIRSFCRRLERRCKIEIIFVDEYLSTVEAWAEISRKGKRNSKKQAKIDAVSAALILQTYLDK